MNTVEDRLRAAAQVITEVIPEGSAPPLRLAEPRIRRPGAGQRGRRQRADWVAPLAAAAAMILVATTSVAVSHGWFGSGRGAATGPDGTPPYYVSLASYTSPHSSSAADATVRSTATGSVLARITPPRPYTAFSVVTGAADDSTFVLGAERAVPGVTGLAETIPQTLPPASFGSPASSMLSTGVAHDIVPVSSQTIRDTQFFTLRLDSGASSPRLARLRMAPQTQPVAAAALSPDGRLLAVALTPPGRLVVRVTNLVTYATRTWQGQTWAGSWPGGRSDLANDPSLITLSWAADNRTLALDWPGPVTLQAGFSQPALTAVSLLNTAAGGADLAADSTVVTPPGYLIGFSGNAMVTPDGGTIVSSGLLPAGPARKAAVAGNVALEQFSSSTGALRWQPQIPHWKLMGPVPRVLWTSVTGSVMIISTSVFKGPAWSGGSHGSTVVGVLTKGTFTLLPGLRAPTASVDTDPAGIAW